MSNTSLSSILSRTPLANTSGSISTPPAGATPPSSENKENIPPSINNSTNTLVVDDPNSFDVGSQSDLYSGSMDIETDDGSTENPLQSESTPHQPGSIGVGVGNIGIGGGLGIGGGVGIGGAAGIGGGAAGNPGKAKTPLQPGSLGVGLGNIGIGGGLGIGGGVGIGGPAGIGGGVSKVLAQHVKYFKDESKPANPYTQPSKSPVFSEINQRQEEEMIMEKEMTDNEIANARILEQDTHSAENNSAGAEVAVPEVIV